MAADRCCQIGNTLTLQTDANTKLQAALVLSDIMSAKLVVMCPPRVQRSGTTQSLHLCDCFPPVAMTSVQPDMI
ncbi:hypothetical protein [Nostoc sp. T09]|uniref:hypothetical protein n=1 Tax=Nostoc sp. T09 TaxID=1932621 RepID=UPI00117FD251|nr:hypothetical protein [Nostoc sp. T09]